MKNAVLSKSIVCVILFLFIGTSVFPCLYGKTIQSPPSFLDANRQIGDKEQKRLLDNIASASLFFTQNQGQFPAEVLFQTHVTGATVYLCKNKIVTVFIRESESIESLDLKYNNYPQLNRMMMHEPQKNEIISTVTEFVDVNPDVVVMGVHRLSYCKNYFIGNDPSKWYTNVPNYQGVTYQDVYPGIDLVYYGENDGGLKYDFIVHPRANVSMIQVRYSGVDGLSVTQNGELRIETRFGTISENNPLVYQKVDGVTLEVHGRYIIQENDVFGFSIDEYNPALPLVIDPGLAYSTYFGGSQSEYSWRIAVDSSGNAYITGHTWSVDFPLENPYDGTYNGYDDVFVSKLSPNGNTLVYSTYLGGSGNDSTWFGYSSIAVDDSGNAYIVGTTDSFDFPLENPYDGTYNGNRDVFVSKLSPSGNTLVYSTYLGGNNYEEANGIAVDSSGNAYVIGDTNSVDFPLENPYDGTLNNGDAFVSKLSPSGNTLVYSTYLGGGDYEIGYGIAVDSSGNAYIVGTTDSFDFPIENPYDGTYNGNRDVFVSKFSPNGNTLVYSTYLGGNGIESWLLGYGGIAVDGLGNAYVTGTTDSFDFPVENAFDDNFNGDIYDYDVFVSKFSPTGETLIYSTYLGGKDPDFGCDIAVDGSANAYVIGLTYSDDFPMENPVDGSFNGWCDVFVSKFSPTGEKLVYSTYLGGSDYDVGYGIAVDGSGDAYVIGNTNSVDFPVVNPYDDTINSNYDIFVSKIIKNGGNHPPAIPFIDGPSRGKIGTSYDFIFKTVDPDGDQVKYFIRWGDGNIEKTSLNPSGADVKISHTWASSGTYYINVRAEDLFNEESGWMNFGIVMPRCKISFNPIWIGFLERFPVIYRLLDSLKVK